LSREKEAWSFRSFIGSLSGLAGGEYLPLPASKGLAFPFLLTLDGYPTSPAIYAQGQRFSPKIKGTPEKEGLANTLDRKCATAIS